MFSMKQDLVWAEKYRPKTFNDLVFADKDKVEKKLKEQQKEFQHLLLFSKSGGTGKGSIFNVIKHTLNTDTKEVNASSDRGIDYIKSVVENFVSTKSLIGGSRKLLFLDEVNGLTTQAFETLKGTMEKYQSNCLFVLSTNKIEKIPQPIRSRCYEINLKQPNKQEIYERLEFICKKENVTIEENALKKLISINYPDIRSSINMLQQLFYNVDKITYDMIVEKEDGSKHLYNLIMEKQTLEVARKYWISKNLDLDKVLLDLWKYYWNSYDESDVGNNDNIIKLFAITNDLLLRGNQDIQFTNFYKQIVKYWHKKD